MKKIDYTLVKVAYIYVLKYKWKIEVTAGALRMKNNEQTQFFWSSQEKK